MTQQGEPQPVSLLWQRWPLAESGRDGWLRSVLVALVLVGVSAVLLVSLPPLTALVLVGVLLATLLPFFLPRQYRVGPESLASSIGFFSNQHEWAEFRSYRPAPDGYWLYRNPSSPLISRKAPFYLPRPLQPDLAVQLKAILSRHLVMDREAKS